MRIISGYLGGRTFDSPHGNRTHPMSDKVRGAMFNALGDLSGLDILDPFGGSGALSFEAISRGAEKAIVIESDRKAQQAIDKNITLLGLKDTVKLVKSNCGAWLKNNPEESFSIIAADPPYDNLQPELLQTLFKHLKFSGILILSWPGNDTPPSFSGLVEVSKKEYGDAQLVFYRQVA